MDGTGGVMVSGWTGPRPSIDNTDARHVQESASHMNSAGKLGSHESSLLHNISTLVLFL